MDVHSRSTDWPITTGGTEPGCIAVLLGGSEDVPTQVNTHVPYEQLITFMISANSSANSMHDLPAKSIQLASINYTQFPKSTVKYLQINSMH